MGGGVSTSQNDDLDIKIRAAFLSGDADVQIANSGKAPLVYSEWQQALVEVSKGKLSVRMKSNNELLVEMDLRGRPEVSLGKLDKLHSAISIRSNDSALKLKSNNESETKHWLRVLREEILYCNSSNDSLSGLKSVLEQFRDVFQTEEEEGGIDLLASEKAVSYVKAASTIPSPVMNIVILVVGTRGDVQPFVYLGQALQKYGHRVRLATHADYREDVTTKGGLEYYPLAGDPRKLSEFMVKTGGRLMPDLRSEDERKDIPEKMQMLKEITFSCFPACTAPDPEDKTERPFLADAIISNPVSYGHIHCAEALCIPLHIMFPQPWSPTKCFPHPLSNMGFDSQWSNQNYYSYLLVDEFMWLGLGSIINNFRKQVLHIPPIRVGESGAHLLNDNHVPISHMWSPTFVPKCKDWKPYVDVVGEYRSMNGAPSAFVPPKQLVDFLSAGSKPIYIGFGSMVIEDSSKLVEMIKAASDAVGCRVLLQSGWTKYAEDFAMLNDKVMVIGAMPHDWLLYQVCGVVHHGGAGTTSAGLRAGNPTFICPFFGDQHFWAEMVHRAGCGPRGCPIGRLTPDKLIFAFEILTNQETIDTTKDLAKKMNSEDGVKKGVESFHENLPVTDMICEVSIFNKKQSRLACIYCQTCGLKMCSEVDAVVHRNATNHLRVPFRAARWGIVGPKSAMEGVKQGVGVAAYEIAGGIYDLFAKPIEGAYENGVVGAIQGASEGVARCIARPMIGGAVLVERVATGFSDVNTLIESNDTQLTNGKSNKKSSFVVDAKPTKLTHSASSQKLTPEEAAVEEAYFKTLKVLDLWKTIDKSKDRLINAEELGAIVPNAKAFFLAADINNDGVLTFAEFAWQLAKSLAV